MAHLKIDIDLEKCRSRKTNEAALILRELALWLDRRSASMDDPYEIMGLPKTLHSCDRQEEVGMALII